MDQVQGVKEERGLQQTPSPAPEGRLPKPESGCVGGWELFLMVCFCVT